MHLETDYERVTGGDAEDRTAFDLINRILDKKCGLIVVAICSQYPI
ncbi:MAG: hypothetical protein LUQ47_02890 [Methanotrichaceae archaeon]|nr:hypothetical protein [Methanotrichaceae archaeon]